MTGNWGCGGCDNRWSGLAVAHCSRCHRTFASVSGFDKHQDHRRDMCLEPATLRNRDKNPVFESKDTAGGVHWALWASPEKKASRKKQLDDLKQIPNDEWVGDGS